MFRSCRRLALEAKAWLEQAPRRAELQAAMLNEIAQAAALEHQAAAGLLDDARLDGYMRAPERMGDWWLKDSPSAYGVLIRHRHREATPFDGPVSRPAWDRMLRLGKIGPGDVLFNEELMKRDAVAAWGSTAREHWVPLYNSSRLSACGRYVACMADAAGDDSAYVVLVYDVGTAGKRPQLVGHLLGAMNASFLRKDEHSQSRWIVWNATDGPGSLRASRVMVSEMTREGLGKPVEVATADERFFMDTGPAKDGTMVSVNWNDRSVSRVGVITADGAVPRLRMVWSETAGTQCFVERFGESLVAVVPSDKETRVGHVSLSLCGAESVPPVGEWSWLEPDSGVEVFDMDVFASEGRDRTRPPCLLTYERRPEDGMMSMSLWQQATRGGELTRTRLSVEAPKIIPGVNLDPKALTAPFMLGSSVEPPVGGSVDLRGGGVEVSRPELPFVEAIDGMPHLTAVRVWIPSDGTIPGGVCSARRVLVPVTVVAPTACWTSRAGSSAQWISSSDRSVVQDACPIRPLNMLLTMYGCYGQVLDPSFHSNLVPLWRRGWGVAFAHVRGGGCLGSHWANQGRGYDKERTFGDAWSVAEGLVDGGWAREGGLVVSGTSAGGTVGAWTLAEQACRDRAIIGAGVLVTPFLDVLGTLETGEDRLGEVEAVEWGSVSTDERARASVVNFDPLCSVRGQNRFRSRQLREIPPTLVVSAVHDQRTPHANSEEWAGHMGESVVLASDAQLWHGESKPELQWAFAVDALQQ
jgi:hypothetical protein